VRTAYRMVGGVRHHVVKPTRPTVSTIAATVPRRAHLKLLSRPGRATVISMT
jgi:hypothetical protein